MCQTAAQEDFAVIPFDLRMGNITRAAQRGKAQMTQKEHCFLQPTSMIVASCPRVSEATLKERFQSVSAYKTHQMVVGWYQHLHLNLSVMVRQPRRSTHFTCTGRRCEALRTMTSPFTCAAPTLFVASNMGFVPCCEALTHWGAFMQP